MGASPRRLGGTTTAHESRTTLVKQADDFVWFNLIFLKKLIQVTLISYKSTEMRLPTRGNIGTNVSGFRCADGSKGHGGSSFGARDQNHFGGISRVEYLTFDQGLFGEKSEYSSQCGTTQSSAKTTADSIASTSSRATIKEHHRHDAVL